MRVDALIMGAQGTAPVLAQGSSADSAGRPGAAAPAAPRPAERVAERRGAGTGPLGNGGGGCTKQWTCTHSGVHSGSCEVNKELRGGARGLSLHAAPDAGAESCRWPWAVAQGIAAIRALRVGGEGGS